MQGGHALREFLKPTVLKADADRSPAQVEFTPRAEKELNALEGGGYRLQVGDLRVQNSSRMHAWSWSSSEPGTEMKPADRFSG